MLLPIVVPRIPTLSIEFGSGIFTNSAGGTSETYNYQTIPSTGDWLLVIARFNGGSSVASITVNGSSMTRLREIGTSEISVWGIAHPGGSDANFVVKTNTTMSGRAIMGIYSLTGTPSSWWRYDQYSNVDGNTTLDKGIGGVILGLGYDSTSAADTWTGITTTDQTSQLGGATASGILVSENITATASGVTQTTNADVAAAIVFK